MKFILLALFIPFIAQAKVCNVVSKADSKVIGTYQGDVCDPSKFGGPWGRANEVDHVEDVAAGKALDDAKTAATQAQADRQALRDQIKALHAKAAAGALTPQDQKDALKAILQFVKDAN